MCVPLPNMITFSPTYVSVFSHPYTHIYLAFKIACADVITRDTEERDNWYKGTLFWSRCVWEKIREEMIYKVKAFVGSLVKKLILLINKIFCCLLENQK